MWLKSLTIPHLKNDLCRFLCQSVEEIHAHLWEMLDSGMICPSQSAWCNAVVLVWKKDGILHFCIDFCHLNGHMKKDSYPSPRIQGVLESLVSVGHFSCLDLKSGLRADRDGWTFKAVYCIYCGQPWFLQVWQHALWAVQCASHISEVNAELPQGAESKILPHLPWWYIIFLQMAEEHLHHLHIVFDTFREYSLKLKPSKCNFVRNEITYPAHWDLKDEGLPQQPELGSKCRMHPTTDLHGDTCFSWPGGPLHEVHQRLHTYYTTP